VTELSRRLGLGKSTTHRLVATLEAERLLEQDPATGKYRLGLALYELGTTVTEHVDLHQASLPVLTTLRHRTGEMVHVAVLDGLEAVYVERLESELHGMGVPARLQIMQSSGAIMSAAEAARRAAYTIESGPAAGVMASAHVGRESGRPDVISFDMGGTTAKAGLVLGGRPRIAQQFRVGGKVSASGQREAGEPIRIPVIDLAEVGAGGGSIAWVDAGGHLRLGPHSAGANPGPACYDQGGTEATVTDANVVLGYLDAEYFNGGKMAIRPGSSARPDNAA